MILYDISGEYLGSRQGLCLFMNVYISRGHNRRQPEMTCSQLKKLKEYLNVNYT